MTATIAATTMLCALGPAQGTPARELAASVRGQHIEVTTTTCAPRWRAPNAGRDHFAIVNKSRYPATILLFHPVSGTVVSSIEVKPRKTHEVTVRLKRGGHYIWGCDLHGRPPRVSDVETVPLDPNHGGTGRRVVPVTRDQLVAPMRTYRHYVSTELTLLETEVASLASDLSRQDTTAAEADWLTAHRTWLRIGQDDGAYGAFGPLGREIDGTSAGLARGTSDPAFTGFHKIEFDLWTTSDVAAATTDTAVLARAVARVVKRGVSAWFPLSVAGVSGLPLRCHEVLEDGLRDSLSGDDDYGSGTSIASVRTDVTATRELLGLIANLITLRSPHLVSRAHGALTRLAVSLDATRSKGKWVAVNNLSRSDREALDAAVGRALEILSRVPDLLTIGKS